jgi:hypothetical protein
MPLLWGRANDALATFRRRNDRFDVLGSTDRAAFAATISAGGRRRARGEATGRRDRRRLGAQDRTRSSASIFRPAATGRDRARAAPGDRLRRSVAIIAYIVSENLRRRHLNNGQRAVLLALTCSNLEQVRPQESVMASPSRFPHQNEPWRSPTRSPVTAGDNQVGKFNLRSTRASCPAPLADHPRRDRG